MQQNGGAIMAVKSETRTHPREPSFISILSGWARQGAQSLFATQRILLDLAMRQNANVMHALRQQLSDPHHSPTTILSELTGEGVANFIEGQKVLLDLAQEQHDILMHGVKGRIGTSPAAHAIADLLGRTVNTYLDMQQEFLKLVGKQTHTWVEAAKTGKPYQGERFVDLARETMVPESIRTLINPTPAIPSARQWWARITSAVRFRSKPRTRVKSQSGRRRFMTVPRTLPATALGSRSLPSLRVAS
jgi:hypothetical protein